jgi:hypothetical protein
VEDWKFHQPQVSRHPLGDSLEGYMISLCVTLIFVFMATGCKTDSVTDQAAPVHPTITSISPNPAQPGDKVTILGTGFTPQYYLNALRIGGRRLSLDSSSSTQLYTRLPFDAQSGNVVLRIQPDSVVGPFLVINRGCSGPVCVTQYAGQPITESSSWVVGCTNLTSTWSGRLSADSVVLTQSYCVGDDSGIRKTIILRNLGNGVLPAYLGGLVERAPYGTWSVSDTLKGYVAIDQWSVPGVLSGRVSAFLASSDEWWDFNFYCTVN